MFLRLFVSFKLLHLVKQIRTFSLDQIVLLLVPNTNIVKKTQKKPFALYLPSHPQGFVPLWPSRWPPTCNMWAGRQLSSAWLPWLQMWRVCTQLSKLWCVLWKATRWPVRRWSASKATRLIHLKLVLFVFLATWGLMAFIYLNFHKMMFKKVKMTRSYFFPSPAAAGYAAEEEALAAQQPHPPSHLLSGGNSWQWTRDLHHSQLHRFPGPALWLWGEGLDAFLSPHRQ